MKSRAYGIIEPVNINQILTHQNIFNLKATYLIKLPLINFFKVNFLIIQ